jgi:hypothetical protein
MPCSKHAINGVELRMPGPLSQRVPRVSQPMLGTLQSPRLMPRAPDYGASRGALKRLTLRSSFVRLLPSPMISPLRT